MTFITLENMPFIIEKIMENTKLLIKLEKNGHINCPNCGAVITSEKCPYCGTTFTKWYEKEDNNGINS